MDKWYLEHFGPVHRSLGRQKTHDICSVQEEVQNEGQNEATPITLEITDACGDVFALWSGVSTARIVTAQQGAVYWGVWHPKGLDAETKPWPLVLSITAQVSHALCCHALIAAHLPCVNEATRECGLRRQVGGSEVLLRVAFVYVQ
eukprot:TRINITY_DN92716_c0_g1_i1.p2 TRINITY_DN92716_c0_g1~~TRINITY_DN92716_c0_g1_i1.p2  ORF type:complete len:146 (-),score=8.03 TRINITY_DN92716_c0_g1_i1:71-508(-)